MKRQIAFAGPLADTFTHDTFALDVDDLASLLNALNANFPGFKSSLRQHRNVAVYKLTDKRASPLTEDEFALSFGSADTILIGADEEGSEVVSFAAVSEWLASYGVSSVIAAAIVYVAVNVAIAYAANAAMKALSKSPSTSSTTADQNASYLFNGPQNPVEQGGAIPVIYGRFRVGGTVISSDITNDQLAMAQDDTLVVMAGQSYSANVTTNDVLAQYLSVTNWTLNGTSYGSSGTITVADTTSYVDDGSGLGHYIYVSNHDGYTVTLASTGAVTVTSGVNATATLSGTYMALDSTTSTSSAANVKIKIAPVVSYMSNGTDEDGNGPTAPGDAPGEGSGIGGTGGSAGDASSGDSA